MTVTNVSYLKENNPQTYSEIISKLPRWMWLSDTARTNRGPQLEGRLRDELGYIVNSCISVATDDISPWEKDIVNAVLDCVYNEDNMSINDKVRFKPGKVIAIHPGLENACRWAICIFLTLEQRLGLVALSSTSDVLEIVGIEDKKIQDMFGYNAYLTYQYHGNKHGTEIFSKAPIRRYGFCNHFEYMLCYLHELAASPQLQQESPVLKDREVARLQGIIWMRKLHVCFLNIYWGTVHYISNEIRYALLPGNNFITGHLQSSAEEAVSRWLYSEVDKGTDISVGDVHEMIDLIERRLCNWDLN
jgi:hypothetical protein